MNRIKRASFAVVEAAAVPILRGSIEGFGAILVVARRGDWAITRFASAGVENPEYRFHSPRLSPAAITWLGDGAAYGKLLTDRTFSDAKLAKALRRLTGIRPEQLVETFKGKRRTPGLYLGLLRRVRQMPGGAA